MKIFSFFKTRLFRNILIALSVLMTLLIIVFMLLRDSILQRKMDEKIDAFNKKYPATLIVAESHFTGISGIEVNGICLIPDNKDTLIRLGNVHAGLKFFPLLFGDIKLRSLEINDCAISVVKKDSTDNYSFLLKRDKKDTTRKEKGYSALVDKLSDTFFNSIPDKVTMNNCRISVSLDSSNLSAQIDYMAVADKQFFCPIKFTEDGRCSIWNIKGSINKSKRIAGITVIPDTPSDSLPYLKDLFGLKMKFDSLSLGVETNTDAGGICHFNGYLSAYGLQMNHKKISATDVIMNRSIFNCKFNIGKDFIELDSSSSFTYNKLELNPYFLYQKGVSNKYTFKMHNEFNAQDLFGSLPAGLFTNFENISTSGELSLDIDFFVDMQYPDSLVFSAGLTGKDFRVLEYGETDFSKIAGPFMHTVYENGVESVSFLVGEDNPDFTSIEDISLALKEAVIIAENGGTYYQTGFDINSLRLAIIQDIKEGKFVRGGSTIEMQLVKNVFLTRSKTVARKVEELLIVWLIQSGNLCSHNRMFEVYLNIAEWGPGIYGISQAALFYFNKTPALLTVPESIFLASILPRPKWFKYSFDKAGNLDPEMNGTYFSSIASLLVERGTISASDTFNLLQKVKLRAESKALMMQDTSYFDTEEMLRQDQEFMKKGTVKEQNKVQESNNRDPNKKQENDPNHGNKGNNNNINTDDRRKDPRKK